MEKITNSIQEAAEILGLSRQSVYNELNSGRLKSYKVGKRRFISSEALVRYVNDREADAA